MYRLHRRHRDSCGTTERKMQRMVQYNARERKHVLKYQAVPTPDGMILYANVPIDGGRHK